MYKPTNRRINETHLSSFPRKLLTQDNSIGFFFSAEIYSDGIPVLNRFLSPCKFINILCLKIFLKSDKKL